MPYYVNDLDRFPLAEVANSGAHDPKALWPATSGLLGALANTAGFFAALFGPWALLPVALASAAASFLGGGCHRLLA